MAEEITQFAQLGLAAPVLKALDEVGYEAPYPIQAQGIPPLLAGRDLLGQAQPGTGKTATPDIAQEVHAQIRACLVDLYGRTGGEIRIQYGGSVKPENVDELMAQPDIDGALVGGASLDPEAFARIACFQPAGGAS